MIYTLKNWPLQASRRYAASLLMAPAPRTGFMTMKETGRKGERQGGRERGEGGRGGKKGWKEKGRKEGNKGGREGGGFQ